MAVSVEELPIGIQKWSFRAEEVVDALYTQRQTKANIEAVQEKLSSKGPVRLENSEASLIIGALGFLLRNVISEQELLGFHLSETSPGTVVALVNFLAGEGEHEAALDVMSKSTEDLVR